jgi:hypothetical protein
MLEIAFLVDCTVIIICKIIIRIATKRLIRFANPSDIMNMVNVMLSAMRSNFFPLSLATFWYLANDPSNKSANTLKQRNISARIVACMNTEIPNNTILAMPAMLTMFGVILYRVASVDIETSIRSRGFRKSIITFHYNRKMLQCTYG